MKFLRTVSTRRLLALIAGLIIAVVGGTAIALAASGQGPVPPHKKLARAIHDALTAPEIPGITARISFSNHLIDASELQGSDPILSGASGRLWLSPTEHRLRLELQADNGQDAQVVVGNGSFWVYDPSANTVYRGSLPKDTGAAHKHSHTQKLPSVAEIQTNLNQAMEHLNVSSAIPGDVARRPAYTVRVAPKHDGGLLGDAQLAWDALRGLPLRFALYARGEATPVLELKVTRISYGKVPVSDFSASPPRSAKTVTVSQPTGQASKAQAGKHGTHKRHPEVSGVRAVARHLQFKLAAPSSLVGLPRRSVSLLDWGGSPAALVSYGQNLGGIAVIEQTASSSAGTPSGSSSSGDQRGLHLPTVSINGASGTELATALGTVVRFTSGAVTYTVLGSVPPAAAEAAARKL